MKEETPWPYDIDTYNPRLVYAEVRKIVGTAQPAFRFERLSAVFEDIVRLYRGHYPGYKACNTPYHDLTYVLEIVLATARLLQGASVAGFQFTRRNIGLALTVALMEGTGFIQKTRDRSASGAQYMDRYIERSIKFTEDYFLEHGYSIDYFKDAKKIMRCIESDVETDSLSFSSEELRTIGKIVTAGSIMGQIGTRIYPERLLLLHQEFVDGRTEVCDVELDIFRYIYTFNEIAKDRIRSDLADTATFMAAHFKSCFGTSRDIYSERIDANLKHIRFILEKEGDYRKYLRRGGVVTRLT